MKLKTALNETKDYKKAAAKELMKFVIEFEKDEKGKTTLLLNSYQYNSVTNVINKHSTGTTKNLTFTSSSVKDVKKKLIDTVTSYKNGRGGYDKSYMLDQESFNAFFLSLEKAVQNYNDINVTMDTPETGGMWDVKFYITEYQPIKGKTTIRIGGIKFSHGEENEIRKKKRLFSK